MKSKAEKPIKSGKVNKQREAYNYLMPTYILMLLLMGYPLLNSVLMSFQKYKIMYPKQLGQFNGLANFAIIFTDPYLGQVALNTVIFVLGSLIPQFLLGLVLAMALSKPFKGRNIYQAVVFLPWAISSFIIGLTFRWLFNEEYGAINDILMKLGLIKEKIAWMGTPGLSLLTVVVAAVWVGVPFFAIMLLAALQSVPKDLYEAADIDGASPTKKFFKITIPYIKPTIIVTLLLRTVWLFNSADLIFVMTSGGPANSSHTLASYMFSMAYASLDFGQAAALGVIFMLFLGLFVVIFLKVTKYNEAGNF